MSGNGSTEDGVRIGVDVGGTFTDLVCVTRSGEVLLDKTPTTLADQSEGVMRGLDLLATRLGLTLAELCGQMDLLVHGTTTGDNTMIEMDGASTGLLVTAGHRDEIEMRRVHKEQIWDPAAPPPTPIARRRARIAIDERVDHRGTVVTALDEEAVRRGVRRLRQLGVTSIAVMYLFSFVRPEHERRTRELILEEYPEVEHVSLSHEVMPRGPEFERTSTTLVNAYIAPRIERYVHNLIGRLRDAGYGGNVLIMQSTGGVTPPDGIGQRAVTLLGSGPTGGVMGATDAARRAGIGDFVAVDMGGTSFDLCLVRNGTPEVKTDWNWRYRYYIGLPMVDVQSVGAGGGSIARVRQGALLVGPDSAGSMPGPVCYGRGGDRPTVTDADAVLGYLDADAFAGGRMQLDVEAARAAIARDVGTPLGLGVAEAAWGIERIVNANMANATRRMLSGYGADPRELALIAYGGNGAVHAWAIAAELGIDRVVVPRAAPAFSALGLLVADARFDRVRSVITPLSRLDVSQLDELAVGLDADAAKELDPIGLPDSALHRSRFVQMCYPGQNFDMSVPVDDHEWADSSFLIDLADRFHDVHERDRGFSFRAQEPLVRGLRLVVTGDTPRPPTLATKSPPTPIAEHADRPVWFGDGFVTTPVRAGSLCTPGEVIEGPALIAEAFTVIVVPPAWRAALDADGTYLLSRHARFVS